MTISLKDRIRGGIYGALVGDALGVPVEFADRYDRDFDPVAGMRGYGTWSQPPGTWSDDGALLLCSAEALLDGYSAEKMASGFVAWLDGGQWAAHGMVFDVGGTTRRAIRRLASGVDPEQAGGQTEESNGNGSLMRILPVGLRFHGAPPAVIAATAARASRLTHAHPRACLACSIYSVLASRLLAGDLVAEARQKTAGFIRGWPDTPAAEVPTFERALAPALASAQRWEIGSGGYVVDTLEAALWCLLTNASFEATVLAAVNLGSDTDTTGCVAGGLAGIVYGVDSIPLAWRSVLPHQEELEHLVNEFAARCESSNAVSESPESTDAS